MHTSFSSMIFLRRASSVFISLTFSSRSFTCKLALVCSSTCMVSITSISEILRLSIIESEVGAFLSLTSVGSSTYTFGGFFFEADFSFDVSLDLCGFFDLLSPFFSFGFLFSDSIHLYTGGGARCLKENRCLHCHLSSRTM